ncbi:DUF2782 domain-containing protein [Kushneria phyllosphaerae]|uniref:PepSY domain-containing protein n=1 Tax=Kushneria phyllosphaerae TaxID=2100822 RepID=A0A2R8CJD0_9GAMM|nr:DUF2782 domain-containing protein [Kushneria phyllosphaerae]SPJ32990.1 hypothetical protein KSP9073_00992 [Kushneria phyllosphaerae]
MTIARSLPVLTAAALLALASISPAALAEPRGQVTTQQQGDRLVHEYRLDGRLYAIEIIEGQQRTVLLDTDGDGNFRRQPADAEITPPAWTQKSSQ